tara:strand:- start:2562 stop:3635 length:1074 start_codon:yes stop_codon:yes gene_type:complete
MISWSSATLAELQYGPMPPCLERAVQDVTVPGGTQTLSNLSGGSYHVWAPGDTPLRLANASLGAVAGTSYPMAVLVGIGPQFAKYVTDFTSEALVADGIWELSSLGQIAAVAGAPSLPSTGTFLDVGAHVGSWTFGFAQAGFRVIAIEPLLPNVAALQATRCLHPSLAERVTIVPAVVGSASQLGPCHLLAPAKNDLGNVALQCADPAAGNASVADYVNAMQTGNTLAYFHHHRRFKQLLPWPLSLLTLDALLLDGASDIRLPTSLDVVKIDTTGSECAVLEGGKRALLHKLRPKLLVINVDLAASEACARTLAAQHSFEVFELQVPEQAQTGSSHPLRSKHPRGKHIVLVDRTARL